MTKVAIAEEVAEQIRSSEGPIELVDAQGQTIGVVRRLRAFMNCGSGWISGVGVASSRRNPTPVGK